MNKFLILFLAALLALGLFTTACGNDDDDDDNNPQDAVWAVGIASIGAKDGSHGVTVSWVGEAAAYVEPSSLVLEIGGDPITLGDHYNQFWMGETNLTPGQEYNVKLTVNNDVKCNTTLKTAYEATGDFPADYSPANAATVTWTLSSNNQKQYATATSFSPVKYSNDSFSEEISASARSFTFPAGAVDDFGNMTSYTLSIDQMNTKTVDGVMLIASQSTHANYTSFAKEARQARQEDFLRLVGLLR